ncbi:MAG TPA: hypothetical protein VF746_02610 [Longimicrobium sp.]|jgi:hypothetical protein
MSDSSQRLLSPEEYEWALFEKLLYDFPPPAFRVEHNVSLPGNQSGTSRQVDVVVYKAGDAHPFLIADAKLHKRKVDLTVTGSFLSMLLDTEVGAGLLVAPEGFSKGAENQLKQHNVAVMQLSLDKALTLCWRSIARGLLPWDWAFHPDMAPVLRLIDEKASPDELVEATAVLPFEEWEAVISFGMHNYRQEARSFLCAIALEHWDDAWRFNAVRLLNEFGSLDNDFARALIQRETDPETLALLEVCCERPV